MNLQDKIRFFQQYSGQKRICGEDVPYKQEPFEWEKDVTDPDVGFGFDKWIELRDPKDVPEEEWKQIGISRKAWGGDRLCDAAWQTMLSTKLTSDQVDQVRVRGIAFGWNGLKVRELLEMNWIRYKR